MRIVIIGLGTGGLFSAVSARKQDRTAEITILDRKGFDILHSCGMPYYIGGEVESAETLKDTLPQINADKMKRHEAISIDRKQRSIRAKSLEDGEEKTIHYDKLILSPGSHAFIPPIPGANELLGKGVFKLDSFEDAVAISSQPVGKAVVVGAGAIGIETAYALKLKGFDVTLVEMLDRILPNSIDPDMSKPAEEYVQEKGIRLMLGQKVESVQGNEKVESITVDDSTIDCSLVIFASGVQTNISLAQDAGLVCSKRAIIVNDHLQTSDPDIYALGDAVQVRSLVDGRDWISQLASTAYKQGMVAGANAAGADLIYKGSLSSFVTKVGELEIAATGFNSSAAGDVIIGKASGPTRPEWAGEPKMVTVKILVDRKSHRIVGAQAVGKEGAAHRIDICATAIKGKFTIFDLAESEMCYCPAVSETYDVLMQAADNAIRNIARKNR